MVIKVYLKVNMMPTNKGKESYIAELPSDEMQEIISYVPHYVVRWGIGSFLIVLFILLIVSWMVHYPDVVNAPFRLTSKNAPKALLSPIETKLTRILARDKEVVSSSQPIAFLEATGDHRKVIALASQLDTLSKLVRSNGANHFQYLPILKAENLGELQTSFQVFSEAYDTYLSYEKNGYYDQKRAILEKELWDLKGLEKVLNAQLRIQSEDYRIAEEEFQVHTKLAEQKVIAALELKRESSRVLVKELPLKQTQALLFENKAAISSKQKELLDLDDALTKHKQRFLLSINTIQSEIDSWKKKYIITAPLHGTVNYSSFLEENQPVSSHQELFYISPLSKDYFGELLIPQQNFGKVVIGQKVLIKFASYPFQEFGLVEGKVESISDIPAKDNTFLAKVSLPGGLVTTHRKQITYKSGMNATAEIITNDTRLIEKFVFNFKKAVSR